MAKGRGGAARDFEALRFYESIARTGDAAKAFPRPVRGVGIERQPTRSRSWASRDVQRHDFRFASPYEPLNPAAAPHFERMTRNNVAHAQHWCHGDVPRPTLIVVHGFGLDAPWLNARALSLERLYRDGYDILLFTYPYHGRRAEPGDLFSGYGLIHWTLPAKPDLISSYATSYGDPNAYPIDARGVGYTYAFVGIRKLGAAQFYLISIKDKDDRPYEGHKTYRLRVPAKAPIKDYWSVTAYDRQLHTVIKGMPHASRSSRLPDFQKNDDGSVDIFIGPKPRDDKDANWLPTDPARRFDLMFRFYGPTPELFNKSWKLPDVEAVE
jgi:hypothetical protein